MRLILACLAAIFAPSLAAPLAAQERPPAMLVLDGSNSMWGQIDGVAKIGIAQSAIGDMLETLDPAQQLGLTAYGHRVEADCGDIQTLVMPGADTRAAIARTVNRISPRGRTPLSDAVQQAARDLNYAQAPATVILVTDGLENCGQDPCAVGRALEDAGQDFTAHVIGFDVSEEDRPSLQCLADATGGSFLSASDAAELGLALTTIAEKLTVPQAPDVVPEAEAAVDLAPEAPETDAPAPAEPSPTPTTQATEEPAAADEAAQIDTPAAPVEPPPPAAVPVTFNATEGDGGPAIDTPLVWTLTGPDGPVFTGVENNFSAADLPPGGTYEISAARPDGSTSASASFSPEGQGMVIKVVFPVATPSAALDAQDSATIGALLAVGWRGPNATGDYISVADPEEPVDYRAFAYTRAGSPTNLRMPATPGTYELRYHLGSNNDIMATRLIQVQDVATRLDAPNDAPMGSVIEVDWIGPDEEDDYVAISDPNEPSNYIGYGYTRQGNPVSVRVPDTPGVYELRYHLGKGGKILATREIEVTLVEVALRASDSGDVGETLRVAWDGPDEDKDYIAVSDPAQATRFIDFAYTSVGDPVEVVLPDTPGLYELRYHNGKTHLILATRPIQVDGPEPAREAPADTPTKDTIQQPDAPEVQPTDQVETETEPDTQPDALVTDTPDTADTGDTATGNAEATLAAPDTAPMGATIPVSWTGPDDDKDFISIAEPGAPRYVAFGYTESGNPTDVLIPDTPGTYELRYQRGDGGQVLARQLIEVTLVTATLDAPPDGPAGADVSVTWTGPDYPGDFIGIGAPGQRYQRFQITELGSPASIRLPTKPGAYEIRYYLRRGGKVLVTRPFTVTE